MHIMYCFNLKYIVHGMFKKKKLQPTHKLIELINGE